MNVSRLLTAINGWLAAFVRQQADMAEKTELFLEAIPWRTEQ